MMKSDMALVLSSENGLSPLKVSEQVLVDAPSSPQWYPEVIMIIKACVCFYINLILSLDLPQFLFGSTPTQLLEPECLDRVFRHKRSCVLEYSYLVYKFKIFKKPEFSAGANKHLGPDRKKVNTKSLHRENITLFRSSGTPSVACMAFWSISTSAPAV